MRKVMQNLFVGNEVDYETNVRNDNSWAVVHACKEPYHRQALGYSGRGAPKGHPEYLIAKRGTRLILNMVDADNPAYIPKEIIDAALQFIHEQLASGKKVLVHCNQGASRSAPLLPARNRPEPPAKRRHSACPCRAKAAAMPPA
jgi:hypothetical protein